MAAVVVKLGSLEFSRYEVPQSIAFGGSQRLAVHNLVGGERVVDVLGRQDSNLGWSGLFLGVNALARAMELDALRIKGEPLTLTWSELRYQVVIQKVVLTFEREYQIAYNVECVVVEDQSNLVASVNVADEITKSTQTLTDTAKADVSAAKQIAVEIGDTFLTPLFETLDEAIATVSDIATAAQETIDAILTPLAAIQQRVVTLISTAGNTVAQISTLGGLLPGNVVSQNAQALSGQATGFLTQGRLYDMRSKLGRVDQALSQGRSLGSSVKTITTAGGDLFRLASDLYNDATKWDSLASLNNLDDPLITGTAEIRVPLRPASTGGVSQGS